MSAVIYCDVNMFDYDQTIYLKDGDNELKPIAKVPMENLSNFIAKYCNENNIEEVHIVGFTTQFTSQIKKGILKANNSKFNDNIRLNIILTDKRS